jgi:hypothetical protein
MFCHEAMALLVAGTIVVNGAAAPAAFQRSKSARYAGRSKR